MEPVRRAVDPATERATSAFIEKVRNRYAVSGAILFGSRTRGTHNSDSDADLAVLLDGTPGNRVDIAVEMADVAFDVLLETGVLVQPLPLREGEIDEPGRSLNEVEQLRLLADYATEEIDAQKAAWAVEQAANLVAAVDDWLAGPSNEAA